MKNHQRFVVVLSCHYSSLPLPLVGWLRQYFPNERRAVAAHYLSYREEQTAMKRASDRDRLRTIVRELHANGTFPSMNAVLDVFNAGSLKRTEVWSTIKEVREELITF